MAGARYCLIAFLLAKAWILLGFLMETIAAALGALTGKRNVALGISMSIAIALFVLYSLAPLVDFFDTINPVNPFQWTIGSIYFYGKRDIAG